MNKRLLLLSAILWAVLFTACGDDSSSSPSDPSKPSNTDGPSDNGKTGSVCDFKKSDNVWKFSYSTWNFSEEYTWVDESTVEYKEYMNSYHMDEDDTTYTDVNRDEFFDRIMERCLDLNDLLDESSSSSVDKAPEPAEGPSSDKAADVSSSSITSSSSEVLMTSSSSESDISSSSDNVLSSSSVTLVPPCRTDSTDTCEYGTLTDDRDGQIYKTVKIGDQWWMAENLNYAYTDVPLDYSQNSTSFTSDSTSWCYNDSAEYCAKYGRFYTWSAAMDSAAKFSDNGKGCGYGLLTCELKHPVRGVCPSGWHIPSVQEFETLYEAVTEDHFAIEYNAGFVLKSTDEWLRGGNGSDSYGFSALPAGQRHIRGVFVDKGYYAYFWTSDPESLNGADYYFLTYTYKSWHPGEIMYTGLSVRCIKDED